MNEKVKELQNAETEPVTGMEQTPEQPSKPKKGFLKTVKDFAVNTYVKVHSNPIGRIACKLAKAGTAVLVVKKAYDTGFKDGQKNPVVMTITPIEENSEEAPAEPEQTVEEEPEEKEN